MQRHASAHRPCDLWDLLDTTFAYAAFTVNEDVTGDRRTDALFSVPYRCCRLCRHADLLCRLGSIGFLQQSEHQAGGVPQLVRRLQQQRQWQRQRADTTHSRANTRSDCCATCTPIPETSRSRCGRGNVLSRSSEVSCSWAPMLTQGTGRPEVLSTRCRNSGYLSLPTFRQREGFSYSPEIDASLPMPLRVPKRAPLRAQTCDFFQHAQ